MDHKRLGVAHVGEIAREAESVHRCARNAMIALDTKAQHAAVRVGTEQLLGTFVVRVIFEPQVRDPCDFGMFLEPAKGVAISGAERLGGYRKKVTYVASASALSQCL